MKATVTIENINWHLEQGKEGGNVYFGWCSTNRDARICVLTVYLYCIRPHVFPGRCLTFSVCTHGRGGHVCNGDFVHIVADAGANNG